MRTTFDAEADALDMTLVSEVAPGRSVGNEVVETAGGTVLLDFDETGKLVGVEVLGATKLLDGEVLSATKLLDGEFLAGAERIDQQ